MMFIEAIESVKCRDEGVIESTADANIGSTFGIASGVERRCAAVHRQTADPQNPERRGASGFVERARTRRGLRRALRAASASLVEQAERGGLYESGHRRRYSGWWPAAGGPPRSAGQRRLTR